MRTSTYSVVLVVIALMLVAACSTGAPRPAPVRNYGPEASGPYAQAQAPTYTQPRRVPSVGPVGTSPGAGWEPRAVSPTAPIGSFQWHTRIADAQADARAQGKLILVLSTKPRCSLCDKFKTQVVPPSMHRLRPVAVGYIYDITRPEAREVDRTLRGNLRGADLMPLVAFLTPDLRFVHGFWGARTTAQFRGDIGTAARIYPVSTAAVERTVQPGSPRLATVVNEYGEPEWSLPGDVWPEGEPEPIDAITGSPALAEAPAVEQPATPAIVTQPPVTVAVAPATIPAPPPPPVAPMIPNEPAPYVGIQAPMLDVAPAPPVAEAPVASPAAAPENWGDEALRTVISDIRGGRFGAARATLERVRDRLPDTTHAREAAKGRVALYNAKRIRNASSSSERSRYLARARRDLGASMWGVLFTS